MFNTGTDFKVYNLGAYVMDAPLSETGMMGIVVSKKQVKVNFARNDIQHDCEVYNGEKGILAIVKKNRIKKTRKVSRRLNTWERVATLKDLRDKSQDLDDIQTLSLIPTAQGKHVTLNQIRKMKQQWCFAPMGDRYADKLMERDQALCLSQSIMTDLGYTGIHSQFFTWLTNNQGRTVYGNDEWSNVSILFVEFDSLRDGISDSYSIIPAKKYTASERRIINVLQSQGCWDGRNILLGYSDTARGWTDGSSYIAIERNWLRKQSVTWGVHIAGIQMLMAHEMAHDDDSRGTHIHGPEFDASLRSYLERPYSSISYCADFKGRMLKSRVEDKRQKEQDKIDNAKAKQDKKLNVAAFVS